MQRRATGGFGEGWVVHICDAAPQGSTRDMGCGIHGVIQCSRELGEQVCQCTVYVRPL